MAGTINSLGIGSGVLTADLIDKLKANERSATVDPIEGKITLATQKQEAMDLLTSLTSTFKSNVSGLSLDTLYQERTITGSNDDVSVTATTGTELQSFSITDVSLAKTNVQQSGSFTSKDDTIATGAGTLSLSIGGESFNIDYDATTTLSGLQEKISSSLANDELTPSILQIGENDFTFILTSKNTGVTQSIALTDNAGNLDSRLLSTSHKSGVFVAQDDLIAATGTSGNVHIDINGITSDIAYDDTTTLTQLKDAINADTALQGSVTASIVKEGDFDFKLVLTPVGAQSGQTVNITDTAAGLDAKILSTGSTTTAGTLSEVQSAKDSSFKYNGIDIIRSSNTVDDLLTGVTISLLKDTGSANITISQDRQPIITELTGFVASYNALQTQLTAMTKADLDAGKVGIFNGDTTIRNIGREITKITTSLDDDGNSLAFYGIELEESGNMIFNQSTFNETMDKDPEAVGKFFSGETTTDVNLIVTHEKGIFEILNDQLTTYTKSNGLFEVLNGGLETEFKSLNAQHERTLDLLNSRYDTMTQRFIAYDSIINSLNNQASALTQQIDMAIAAQQA